MTANPFASGGAAYALHRPDYPPDLVSALAECCQGRDHALDVGCGNGQLTVALARAFRRVTGTDPSASQIASAATHPKVSYRVEGAETIGEPDASVDLIVAAQAAHWFDLNRFYPEVKRVLKPGGVIALVSYGVPELEGEVGRAFTTFYWGPIHRFWPPGRVHVEEGYTALPFPFAETRLRGLSIRRTWDFAELSGYVSTWSAAKAAREAGAEDELAAGLGVLRDVWEDPTIKRQTLWPISVRIGRI